jgi:hypothetical protein
MIRLIFFLFILFVGLAIFVFPWYVTLGLVVVLVFSLKFLIRYLFMLPFMAKGKVLDGAKFDVHSITLVPDPNPERTAENEAAAAEYGEKSDPKVFYAIDVTISPKAATGSFKLWDPSATPRPGTWKAMTSWVRCLRSNASKTARSSMTATATSWKGRSA